MVESTDDTFVDSASGQPVRYESDYDKAVAAPAHVLSYDIYDANGWLFDIRGQLSLARYHYAGALYDLSGNWMYDADGRVLVQDVLYDFMGSSAAHEQTTTVWSCVP